MMIRVNDTSVPCPTVHSSCFRCREVKPKAFTGDTASEPLPPPLRSVSSPLALLVYSIAPTEETPLASVETYGVETYFYP